MAVRLTKEQAVPVFGEDVTAAEATNIVNKNIEIAADRLKWFKLSKTAAPVKEVVTK